MSNKTTIAMQKKIIVGGGYNPYIAFVPIPEHLDLVKDYHNNQILDVDVYGEITPRNLAQIRLYWVCCGKVADNTGFRSDKDVDEYIKLKLGHVETRYDKNGKPFYRTKSISFQRMKQKPFDKYMSAAMPIMADMLGVTEEELINSRNDI